MLFDDQQKGLGRHYEAPSLLCLSEGGLIFQHFQPSRSVQSKTYFILSLSVAETLFIVGGTDDYGSLDDVEAVSLSQSLVQCPQVADFPYKVERITAATLGGAPVICGGFSRLGINASSWPTTILDPKLTPSIMSQNDEIGNLLNVLHILLLF